MSEEKKKKNSSWESLGNLAGADGEAVLVLLAGVALFLFGWLAVDFIFPFALLGVYFALVSALSRVANDRHDCKGHLPRSLLWGSIWATLYTLPLAAFVWIIHSVR